MNRCKLVSVDCKLYASVSALKEAVRTHPEDPIVLKLYKQYIEKDPKIIWED